MEELARRRFEKSARAFMQRTLQLGRRLRPNGLWGFYLYPDCHNYNLHESGYTGLCPLMESLRNDELRWLWNSSTALYPSITILKSHSNSAANLRFARHRVREALRVASLTSNDYDLPTYVYLRLGYRDGPLTFLTTVTADAGRRGPEAGSSHSGKINPIIFPSRKKALKKMEALDTVHLRPRDLSARNVMLICYVLNSRMLSRQ